MAAHEPLFKAVYDTGDTLLMACNEEEEAGIKDKLDNLKYRHKEVYKLTAQRQSQLVEALLLSQQFADICKEVKTRLDRSEALLQKIDEEKSKGIDIQKEKLKGLQDNINQLQPLMSSLKETGSDLIEISGPGRCSDSIQETIDQCEERWNALNKDVEDKGISIGEAAQQAEEVQASIEELLSQLQTQKENFKNLEPCAVQEEPILEQLKKHEVNT